MVQSFDDFLASLTPDVWDEIIEECNRSKKSFVEDILLRNGLTEAQAVFRLWPALISVELLRKYHGWLFSSLDNSSGN